MEKKLFKHAFILLSVVGILDFFGLSLYLFWTVWFFDIILHFLAGVCIAMGGIASWFILFNRKDKSFLRILFIGLSFVIFIGIIWEIFELHFDVTSLSDGTDYYIDTISDLLMDTAGGLLGLFYSFKVLSKES